MAKLSHPDGGEIGGLRRSGAGAPLFLRRSTGGSMAEGEVRLIGHGVRERLALGGPASLSSGELLALVMGSGGSSSLEAANGLLTRHGSLADIARADVLELTDQAGVGRARAAQLVAAFELGRRSTADTGGRWTVRAPRDVADRLMVQLAPLEREELHVVLLNTKNAVLRQSLVYRGNVSSAVVRIAELFRDAVRIHAAGLIVVHNHPSGDPEPSPDDLALTAEAVAAGRLLDVPVLDHVIIAAGGFVSLRDRGVAFDRAGR
jgi:DNA repair protein RadC